ncbi:hypothetical protein SUGI_1204690 [Cryptomeria japonica]|uniref:probable sodium/metabolite cotransporter BASS5, chloroplastic isoform X2 n=1 Tax=Cryptomeria japonica TaxID=3369 RepID=UPI002414BA7A|nr:probable sodium/metabolite cotransporter BASS5, chloroplastic isoform X2 [Cryptomeria japonica]GLJ56120.1 hypothetical protein SUGI_1204690 [Cryptomeria japonica]
MNTQLRLQIPRTPQLCPPFYPHLHSFDIKSRPWKSKPSLVNFRSPPLICQDTYEKSFIKCQNREIGASEWQKKEEELPISKGLTLNGINILNSLKNANSFIPHAVVASTLLALVFPPSFTWFTNRYYAPALGFLMFAVGINSSAKDFILAIKQPRVIASGYIGQIIIKPLLGFAVGNAAVNIFHLPEAIGAGIILISCVSGAQLSNYATFLTEPTMAPLSIVMTALSTASAVITTPLLTLLLLGKQLPVDVKGMMGSIMQIVVAPVAVGLLLNKFAPQLCSVIRPLLPPMSVFVTSLCIGAPLATNINAIRSPFGLTILILVVGFHALAFVAGYFLTGFAFSTTPYVKGLQRTISFQTGMQSSLLGLALANKFFKDPLVGIPSAISVVVMSLIAFGLVVLWEKEKTVNQDELLASRIVDS